ncbi:uncharacterized protein O3C94_018433 [Discoglossus pictus]
MEGFKAMLILLSLWVLMAESQNLIKNTKEQKLEGQMLINEINSDNPGLDITEFVELYHTSGQNVSLDGYSLVFYNGKTNMAYKVLNLSGNFADKRGFFLIGSLGVKPKPSIILPSNIIQNGPDAIALYFGKGPYREGMRVTNDGLVDALVHKSKGTDQAEVLQSVLTPGVEAFLENATFHTLDESIGRCPTMDGKWAFQMTHISPGSENFCKGFPSIVINEVSSPFSQQVYVEFKGPPSMLLSGLVLAFIAGENQEVYYSMDITIKTNSEGIYLLEKEKPDTKAEQALLEYAILQIKGGGAVALYLEKSSNIPLKSRFSTNGLVDSLVYGDNGDMVTHPLQDLTMGRPIILWNGGYVNNSASRCDGPAGHSAVFMFRENTPGRPNDCPPESTIHQATLCFMVSDCALWQGDQVLSDLLYALVSSLQALCKCNVSDNFFTDASFSCQSKLLTLHAKHNATVTLQKDDPLQQFLLSGATITVRDRNASVASSCHLPTTNPTVTPVNATHSTPASEDHTLLINEVNPNTPGSAEDTEYVELYYTGNRSISLDGYWLVFYNGKNNLAYFVLDLKDYNTSEHGFFLLGSARVTPKPHFTLPANTVQNGVDAVALYYRPGKGYKKNSGLTADGLIDSLVYVAYEEDDANGLLRVLAPGQEAVHEDQHFIEEDESLSRCHGLVPLDHSSYRISRITPLADNDCPNVKPPPIPSVTSKSPVTSSSLGTSASPMKLLISEVGVSNGPQPYVFIEVEGPSRARLQGHTLVLYDSDEKVFGRFGLQGTLRDNGIYLIGTNHTSDQQLPQFSRSSARGPEALALYRGSPDNFPVGSNLTKENLLDAVVYTWENWPETEALTAFGSKIIILNAEHTLWSLSQCPYSVDFTRMPTATYPTPGSANQCPSSITKIHFCMTDDSKSNDCSSTKQTEQKVLENLQVFFSKLIETYCSCSVPPSHIQGLNLTCDQTGESISANIVSYEHDRHLTESSWHDLLNQQLPPETKTTLSFRKCPEPEKRRGSLSTWKIFLLVLLCLLLICGAVGLILYVRKRNPQHYTSIEMNPHQELTMDY